MADLFLEPGRSNAILASVASHTCTISPELSKDLSALLADLYALAQECDATGDAIKY